MIVSEVLDVMKTFAICATSRRVRPGDRFDRMVHHTLFEEDEDLELTDIVCCGPVSRNEMLFSAENGRYYFTFGIGWGARRKTLYGLALAMFFDFKHPTSKETIEEDCKNYLANSSGGGAMGASLRRSMINTISSVMVKKE